MFAERSWIDPGAPHPSVPQEALAARDLLASATGLAVLVTDRRGIITQISPGAERALGWDGRQVRGRRLHDLLDGGAALARTPRSGFASGRCAVLEPPTGRTIDVQVSRLRGRAGRTVGHVWVIDEATALRRELDEVRRRHALDRILVDHLPTAVVGVLDANLRWLTLGGERLTGAGHDPDSTVGRRVGDGL